MNPSPTTYLEIHTEAIRHNYRKIRSLTGSGTRLMAVVKAFAYGHDDIAVARVLEAEKTGYFAVAYLDEGIRLRKAGIRTPILVLHPQLEPPGLYAEYRLEPNIYNRRTLNTFAEFLSGEHISLPIHIKFNTGLNRLGFSAEETGEIFEIINRHRLHIASVFSHLAASEDPAERAFSLGQIKQYLDIVRRIRRVYDRPFIRHICNTSGVFHYPEAHFDMVRVGIGLYGYANRPEWTKELKIAGILKSKISQIHRLKAGEPVGYNRAYIADKPIRTATIPIGHADGIPRSWGNGKGYVRIAGRKAPILGNVCMDMIMVEVTGIECNEGDEVVVFDRQETVEDLARRTHTISYEIITGITRRVKRVII